jgi:hypothetical protein
MRTRNAEIQRVAVATVVSDQRQPTRVAGRKRPQLQLRYSHPRRADARRSCKPAFLHRKNRFFADKRRTATRAGGVSPPWFASATPPAFVSTPPAVPRDFAEAFLQVRFPNTHGGLTPAALVNVRFCIAKIVFSPTNVRSAPRAGGVSPPWPLHARRSCECAFVHRKNRFFADKNVRTATRAGGVNPPWVRYWACAGVHEHTAGSPPRLCGSVPASALPLHARRADGRWTKASATAIALLIPTAG